MLESRGSVQEIAQASAEAAESALASASSDLVFQYVVRLLVQLPIAARAPGFTQALEELGIRGDAHTSLPGLLAAISDAVDDHAFGSGGRSDLGEMAQMALIESLSSVLSLQLPTLFDPEPAAIRRAIGKLSSGNRFAELARSFFARLTYRSLDCYLSRELANHIGPEARFADDTARVAFEQALSQHTFEVSRIVEDFAGGWYGKTVWKEGELTPEKLDRFSRFAFKKIRDELGRRREVA